MIRRKCKYNSLSERNKRTPATGSSKPSSSWSLFTIQDASEDSGQSSGADEYKENEHENKAHLNDAIKNNPNEVFHKSVAKLRHMQMCESVHKELKQVLSNKNKLTRKAFVEPKQSHLGKETKLSSDEFTTSNVWEVPLICLFILLTICVLEIFKICQSTLCNNKHISLR